MSACFCMYGPGDPRCCLNRGKHAIGISKAESSTPTPWAVHCARGCNNGDPIYLTAAEYDRQMMLPDMTWRCPCCGGQAWWDDDIYEAHLSTPQPQP